ncbi:MAG: hypothetical protein IJD49_04305 [Clostridia bacterium]|nr:hypothetical protein [Clostridia bacterium]
MCFLKTKTTIKAEVENVGDEIILHINPEDLKEHLQQKKRLKEYEPGMVVKVSETELIILENFENGTAVLFKNLLEKSMKFDEDTCNYANSSIRKYLNGEFLRALETIVGKDNIFLHTVDLLTDDGLKAHGTATDKISLITTEMYRKYRSVIGENMERWWWTATAWSDEAKTSCVRGVNNGGILDNCYCCNSGGVRPFCILNSEIFVSE